MLAGDNDASLLNLPDTLATQVDEYRSLRVGPRQLGRGDSPADGYAADDRSRKLQVPPANNVYICPNNVLLVLCCLCVLSVRMVSSFYRYHYGVVLACVLTKTTLCIDAINIK